MSAAPHHNLLAGLGLSEGREGLWTSPAEPSGEVPSLGAIPGPAGVVVGWIDVAWTSAAVPCRRLRDPIHVPDPLPEDELDDAIVRTLKHRAKALRTCRFCKSEYVPGHMDSADVCQGCASKHLGVVH